MSERRIREITRPPIVRETTGNRLSRLRTQRGWSQERLAEAAGVRVLTVLKIEHDRRDPRVSTLDALADALGVSLEYLWSGAAQCRHDEEAAS